MKSTLFVFLLILNTYSKAQTHRFIYDITYKKDSTSNVLTKENYIRDISKNETKYYTYDFFVADSLINNNLPFPKDMTLNTSDIIIHRNNSDEYYQYDLLENTVLQLQMTADQKWNLSTEKKKVQDINLQKAVTVWGGRNWSAWFSTEIPFQEGPYKFHGVAGLIVEIYDDRNNYHFRLVKSEKIMNEEENQFIEMSKKMSIPITWDKYKSTKLKYYESPISFIKNSAGNSEQFFLNDGTLVNSQNSKELNERLRNFIRKYNNPIELDKVITYPQ